MNSLLRGFPALVFGVFFLAVALLLSTDFYSKMILVSWLFGLVATSLHFGRKPGGIVWILSIGSAVLLLSVLGQKPASVIAHIAIWSWCLSQLIFSNLIDLKGRGLWTWHLVTMALVVVGCATFQLPPQVSIPDVQFVILSLATVMPLVICRQTAADTEAFWRNLNFQSLLTRGLWVAFALRWAGEPAVLNFQLGLAGLGIVLLGVVLWKTSRVPASVGQNIALTLLVAQICMGAPEATAGPVLLLLVPLSLIPMLGVQSATRDGQLNRVWAKLDVHGLGSPLALALLCLAAYLGTESFVAVGISCAVVMLIGAQIWREHGIEDQLLSSSPGHQLGQILGRLVLYVGGLVVLVTEFVGLMS